MKVILNISDERQLEALRFLVDLGAEQLGKSAILRKKTGVSLSDIHTVQKLLNPRNTKKQ